MIAALQEAVETVLVWEKRDDQQSLRCEWSGHLGWKPLKEALLLKPIFHRLTELLRLEKNLRSFGPIMEFHLAGVPCYVSLRSIFFKRINCA